MNNNFEIILTKALDIKLFIEQNIINSKNQKHIQASIEYLRNFAKN